MIKKSLKLVVTFRTTTEAITMEKLCHKRNVPGRLIPVPREITAGCGMAWCTSPEEREAIEMVLAEEKIDKRQCYELVI